MEQETRHSHGILSRRERLRGIPRIGMPRSGCRRFPDIASAGSDAIKTVNFDGWMGCWRALCSAWIIIRHMARERVNRDGGPITPIRLAPASGRRPLDNR